jgi:energy-coupling factor transporter ATP-binding protein EcfA2
MSKVLTQFTNYGDKITFSGPVVGEKRLPSGVYAIGSDMGGPFLMKSTIYTENLISISDSMTSLVYDKVKHFLTDKVKEAYAKYGLLYKRGILLHGPPGTGKTTVVNQIIELATKEKDMLVFLNPSPGMVKSVAEIIRGIEKNSKRAILVVWEEFEELVDNDEGNILNLLDGILQVENIIYLATTNYLHRIPPRIVNRPSRFADLIEIGFPSANVRKQFFEAKIHKDDNVDIDLWVEKTDGLTIDHLKDIIISVLVLGLSLDDAIHKVKTLPPLSQEDHDDYGIPVDCDCSTCKPSEDVLNVPVAMTATAVASG